MAKPYLIDTHCHIHDTDSYNYFLSRDKKANPANYSPDQMISRAMKNDVKQLICIGTTHEDSMRAHDLAAKYDNVFWAYGIHPEEALELLDFAGLAEVATEPERPSPVKTGARDASRKTNSSKTPIAIGEVGLDYHHGTTHRTEQIKLLEQALQLATDHQLPVIFHVREAFDDFWGVVDNFSELHAVVHSFSDSQANLDQALKHDFYIGVNGIATFADIPLPPLEKMLLETDAPFLAPQPYRGHTNEPAHIKNIANYLAAKLNLTEVQIATQTTKNAQSLFNLPAAL